MPSPLTAPPAIEPTFYYSNLDQIDGADGVWNLDDRLPEVQKYADLKPEDRVIDLGCAEGLISLDVAKKVQHVRGVELRKKRVLAAKVIASERRVKNVSFEVGSVTDIDLPERSYDVVLFLGVFQHLAPQDKWPSMAKVLKAARRSVLFRTPLFHVQSPRRTTRLARLCQQLNFSLTIYPRQKPRGGSFMVMNRVEP